MPSKEEIWAAMSCRSYVFNDADDDLAAMEWSRDILADYCREVVEAGNNALLGIGAPKTVHIGWACKRYEVTYQANLTNPIEHLRDVLAKAPKEETHD
jgi:hypothetical protein